jgi:hypothetical protein
MIFICTFFALLVLEGIMTLFYIADKKDKDEGVNYYQANHSLDSTEHGNAGNNDGIIQRRELLTRLNKLKEEGNYT